ncbi:copper-binding protein [Luteitalea sp. TBR-22]|uniref:cupredoxin domain-containing protein n=1 Tax=Luteitalea sp. TBR-22 TaxID=2802971 RepID=UPI001EF4A289|nr:cupredoxin domain-containing protein [Luteitalea sp. TBR-22]BCS35686.2 copper-binding protein [Luteitalea sp. TBR-22]
MTLVEGIVMVGSVSAIAWLNWYFFFAVPKTQQAAVDGAGLQEALVRVDGGYSPSAIQVEAGRPVRLSFDRADTSGCSEEVVLPDFGIRKFLPTGAVTSVEFTPTQAGTYQFTCGMGMLRGRLVVTSR